MLVPPPWVGSRRTAARVTFGAICLSSSSHFPPMLYSAVMKPVALPPGRARLSTKPAPTGSIRIGNTIGTVRVACSSGATVAVIQVFEFLVNGYELLIGQLPSAAAGGEVIHVILGIIFALALRRAGTLVGA